MLRDHLRRCQALLFPGEEDFGIVPVEAQACGTPVIALAKGGATETVVPLGQSSAPTGVWFAEQTVESLAEAIETFERERGRFDARKIRQHAVGFRAERFEREMFGFIESVVGVGKTRMRRAA